MNIITTKQETKNTVYSYANAIEIRLKHPLGLQIGDNNSSVSHSILIQSLEDLIDSFHTHRPFLHSGLDFVVGSEVQHSAVEVPSGDERPLDADAGHVEGQGRHLQLVEGDGKRVDGSSLGDKGQITISDAC